MHILSNNKDLKDFLNFKKNTKHSIKTAFVPTMGGLHKAHLALVKKAQTLTDNVIVSIFINPLQFDDKNDLLNYPQTLEHDIKMLKNQGVSALWLPSNEDLEINNKKNSDATTDQKHYNDFSLKIHPASSLISGLCAQKRPGHFDGVCTVILKLFNLINPDYAILGKKDLQQLIIIKCLVKQFFLSTEIVAVDTVRDENQVAYSTRLNRLTANGYEASKLVFNLLKKVSFYIKNDNSINYCDKTLLQYVNDYTDFNRYFFIEYLTMRRLSDLRCYEELLKESNHKISFSDFGVFVCVRIEGIRLIDHIEL